MIFDYLYDATAQTAFKNSRQGKYAHDQKVRNLEDIFKILEEKGDAKLTDFVALDLSKLPPITLDSIDVSVLLRKIDTLAFTVKSLEEGLGKVTDVYTSISNTVNDLNKKVSDLDSCDKNRYVCPKCNLKCNSNDEYQTHMASHSEFNCTKCTFLTLGGGVETAYE